MRVAPAQLPPAPPKHGPGAQGYLFGVYSEVQILMGPSLGQLGIEPTGSWLGSVGGAAAVPPAAAPSAAAAGDGAGAGAAAAPVWGWPATHERPIRATMASARGPRAVTPRVMMVPKGAAALPDRLRRLFRRRGA